jgi:polar amino acid transport system substrate-binding protein
MVSLLSMNRRLGRVAAPVLFLALGLGAIGSGQAQPAASPGAGFADPQGLMPRTAPLDVPPVYRPPSVDTLATLRLRGALRVCVVPVEPMVMRDKRGELVGFSVDLARRMAQDIGVKTEFMPTTWVDVIPDLLDRHCDLIATGLWLTLQRALVVNFSQPTAIEGIHLVASRARAGQRLALADYDQPGTTLAVYANTPQEALARRLFPQATLLRTEGDPLQAVVSGQAHAALAPSLAGPALLNAAPGQLFLPLPQPLAATPTALAVRKGDPDFLRFVDTWLQLRRDDGWLEERARFWSSSTDWLK